MRISKGFFALLAVALHVDSAEEICTGHSLQRENVMLQGQVQATLHKFEEKLDIPAGMLKERRRGPPPSGMLKEKRPGGPPMADTDVAPSAAIEDADKTTAETEIVNALADLADMLETLDAPMQVTVSDCDDVESALAQIPPGMLKERRPGGAPPGMLKERRPGSGREKGGKKEKREKKRRGKGRKGRKGQGRKRKKGRKATAMKKLKTEKEEIKKELVALKISFGMLQHRACSTAKGVDQVKEYIRKAEMHLEGAKILLDGTAEGADEVPEDSDATDSDTGGSSTDDSSSSSSSDSSSSSSSSTSSS